MFNTVVLRGKGGQVQVYFILLSMQFPANNPMLVQPKLKWWQNTARYELRLQNLTADEILHLELGSNINWPLTSPISVEVF